MIAHEISTVNAKTHYFQTRNYDLAEKVARLPDSALVGAHEVAALSGFAVTSIQKPEQRKKIGLVDPRVMGRINKWPLGTVRAWLQMGCTGTVAVLQKAATKQRQQQRHRGRPTKAESISILRNQHA